jgi:hypothetical protein
MSNKIRRADLAKQGSKFVVVFQIDPLIIIPIVLTNPERHRTDVAVHDAELYCLRKPTGEMTLKLVYCEETKLDSIIRIGKVAKSLMAKIEQALKREREMIAMETRTPTKSVHNHNTYSRTKAYE